MIIAYRRFLVETVIKEWLDRNLFGAKTTNDLNNFLAEMFRFPIIVKSIHEEEFFCTVSFFDEDGKFLTLSVLIETKSVTL